MLRLLIFILVSNTAFAQCYVNAGPDIDVCKEGTVQLRGIFEGDVTHVEWTGGKGIFEPGRILLETEYTPSSEEAGTEVILTLTAKARGNCPAEMKDEIKLTVNVPVQAIAGENIHACKGNVQLNGQVKGKAKSVRWITNGSGTFDNADKLNAVYQPSQKDLEDKAVSLTLKAESEGVCGTDESTLIVMFDKGVTFTTEKEIYTNGNDPVTLIINTKDAAANAAWTADGTGSFTKKNSTETLYTPSLEDVQKGSISFQVAVSGSSETCTSKTDVVLHFRGK